MYRLEFGPALPKLELSRREKRAIADKLNYDKTLSFASLEKVVGGLSLHENTTPENAISRVPDGCAVVVTKEMELGESIIRGLPESCKLICEAGEFERQSSRFWRGIEN